MRRALGVDNCRIQNGTFVFVICRGVGGLFRRINCVPSIGTCMFYLSADSVEWVAARNTLHPFKVECSVDDRNQHVSNSKLVLLGVALRLVITAMSRATFKEHPLRAGQYNREGCG